MNYNKISKLLKNIGLPPYFAKARIGTANGEVTIDERGVHSSGIARQFNDSQVPLGVVDTDNPNPPMWRILTKSANTSSAKYLQFNNGDDEDTWGHFDKTTANDIINSNLPDWTLSFWFKPLQQGSGILTLEGNLSFDIDYNDNLRLKFGNEDYKTLISNIVYGQWYHVLIRVTNSWGGNKKVQTFVNNSRKQYNTNYSALNSDWADSWNIGARGTKTNAWWHGDVAIEELVLYNFYVNNDQRNELWNNGEGRDTKITTDGTTPVDDSTVVFWYHFNDNSGTTFADSSTNANHGEITGTHYSWEDGGIGNGNSAIGGVKALFFEKGKQQQINLTRQIEHGLDYNFGLPSHFHIVLENEAPTEADLPVFKLEYALFNIGEEIPPTRTIALDYIGGAEPYHNNKHKVAIFPKITTTNAGNPIKESAMFFGRLFRDYDSYDGGVYFLQFDFHNPRLADGSDAEWNNNTNE